MAYAVRKMLHEAKILFTNQRLTAEHGLGPYRELSSYCQLGWWSLILQLGIDQTELNGKMQ